MTFGRATLGSMAVLFVCALTRADDLIVNGGFETGDLTGWTAQAATTRPALSITFPGFGNTGHFSTLFYGFGPEPDQLLQTVPTQQGRAYVLQMWVNNTNSTNGGSARVWWEGSEIYNATPLASPLNEWTRLTFVVVSTGASSELRIGGFGSSGGFMIDDVSLVKATNAPCEVGGDADRDGTVNFQDIAAVLANFGSSCAP